MIRMDLELLGIRKLTFSLENPIIIGNVFDFLKNPRILYEKNIFNYWWKCVGYINQTNYDSLFSNVGYIYLQNLMKKLYSRTAYKCNKMDTYSNNIYLLTKSFIGERTKTELLKVIIISFWKILKNIRSLIYRKFK